MKTGKSQQKKMWFNGYAISANIINCVVLFNKRNLFGERTNTSKNNQNTVPSHANEYCHWNWQRSMASKLKIQKHIFKPAYVVYKDQIKTQNPANFVTLLYSFYPFKCNINVFNVHCGMLALFIRVYSRIAPHIV